ncbi:MAG TPA: T9SS type A sorting domain-containing protein, partial [Terriglobales bacterium]|nr:T9SS type A sorting domain-containing protein [Terriglobales bacterium]
QNYPNPFNPFTTIEYYLPKPAHVSLCIYNILGQKVKTLLDEYQSPGIRRTIWDGKDERGNSVTSGIYFYKLAAPEFSEVKKMLLIK